MKRFLPLMLFIGLSILSQSCRKDEQGSTDAFMRSVYIDGKSAEINTTERTVSAVIPTRTDFTNVLVEFSFAGEQLKVNGKVISNETKLDLTKPVTVSICIGKRHSDYIISAKNTSLPVVRIETPRSITSKSVWMTGASIRIENPDGTLDFEGTMDIRGRGNSTWNYPKKPYAIRLDSKGSILGMPKHKRWVLLANWKDRTLMRNDAAFFLSRQSGLEYTVRGQFVELVLNSKHVGNYYLCEQIKIDKNRVAITEMEPGETDPENITGGYLMEIDTYYDEPNRFRSPRFNLPYMFKEPDEDDISSEAINYMKNYVSALEDILKDDSRIRDHEYEAYLDVDSAIEYMLVEELTNNTDFYNSWPYYGTHSCFMYKDRGGKLTYGPVWDFDYHGFVPTLSQGWVGARRTLYYPALFKDEKFLKRTLEIWNERKADFAKLPDYIDEQAEKIRLSESFNHEMWPIVNSTENGDEEMTFQQAVDRIKQGFKLKFDWMDQHLAELGQ